jgi:hypothetical protein
MSFIQNFFTSRDNNANTQTYVGQTDRLWYDPDTNTLRVSDGNTAGGLPVDYSNGANIVANDLTADTLTVNNITSGSGNISVTANLIITGNISPATDVKIGGVRAGPGANIANDGTLTIDTTGLPLSFGNFTANNNILTIVNVDEDMILATQGNAEIQLVGNIGFYKSNGLPPDPNNLFFFAKDDGQLTIFVPAEDPLLGAVEIIGSSTGNLIPPGQPGAMLHITGNPGTPARVYVDGNDNYASLVARRWNGNVANPTQVLAGEDVLRINATAATDLGGGNVGNVAMAQLRMTALENQTATAQGSEIVFTVTPVGQPAANRVDVANITVANGVTATKFTTAGTVTATGNIDGGNILTGGVVSATGNITGGNIAATNHTGTTVSVTGNIIGGNISTSGVISATGNITGGNIVATNHTGTTVSVTGNITGGNVRTAGQVSATGNITGGNVLTGGVISAAGNITGGNVLTGGLISATGGITSGDGISDSLGSVRSIPQNGQSTNYQLQATDNGQMINITSGNVTVPAGVFASPYGQAITIFNNQNSSNAIVQAANVTIRLAGTAATGNRTLARYGIATLVCVSANTFVISGAGLT